MSKAIEVLYKQLPEVAEQVEVVLKALCGERVGFILIMTDFGKQNPEDTIPNNTMVANISERSCKELLTKIVEDGIPIESMELKPAN